MRIVGKKKKKGKKKREKSVIFTDLKLDLYKTSLKAYQHLLFFVENWADSLEPPLLYSER